MVGWGGWVGGFEWLSGGNIEHGCELERSEREVVRIISSGACRRSGEKWLIG